ncbi:MAG: HDOD domain-containing protein [Acidobacteria bacterium]|nr:HDOD domain-containing protein [Acidobacteriota bacterium]
MTITAPSATMPLAHVLKLIASRAGDLPPMPALAVQALHLTKDAKASARDLQRVIERDQALAARILRIVNSPMFALKAKVSTVSHAVAVLGMDAVRSIIMSASVQQILQTGVVKGHDLGTKLLFEHSWGAGVAARILAERTGYSGREEAFLCGLMHDIGKPILMKNFPERYAGIMAEVYGRGTAFHTLEMQMFGFSHAHVGALVAEKWNFPKQLIDAIGAHHDPLAAEEYTHLTCLASLANAMMVKMEIGFEKNRDLELQAHPAAGFLNLGPTVLDEISGAVGLAVAAHAEA